VEAQSAWARAISTRIAEAVAALALLVCGAFFVWQAALLPFGEVGQPGPGFFPFALGIVLGALALVILLRTARTVDALDKTFLGHRNVLVTIGALIGVAVAFQYADTYRDIVDAYLVLGTFTVVMLVAVGRTQFWRAALGACLGMIAVWAIFSRALGVRLPTGELWRYITGPVGELWKHIAGSAAATLPSAPF
jgi:hypothetical protein